MNEIKSVSKIVSFDGLSCFWNKVKLFVKSGDETVTNKLTAIISNETEERKSQYNNLDSNIDTLSSTVNILKGDVNTLKLRMFDASIKEYNNCTLIAYGEYTLVDTITLTNVRLIGGTFIKESSSDKSRMFYANGNTSFIGTTFKSTMDKYPVIDTEGGVTTSGVASNVIAIASSGNNYVSVDNCNFTNCYGIITANGVHLSVTGCSFDHVEMGIYSDNSYVIINGIDIIVSALTNSSQYHALYIPTFKHLSISNSRFEYEQGGSYTGNLIHFYSPNDSNPYNLAMISNCYFKQDTAAFRVYNPTIFDNCTFDVLNTVGIALCDTHINGGAVINSTTSNTSSDTLFRCSGTNKITLDGTKITLTGGRFCVGFVDFLRCKIDMDGIVLHSPDNTRDTLFDNCNIFQHSTTANIYLNANAEVSYTVRYKGCTFDTEISTIKLSTFGKASSFDVIGCYGTKTITTKWMDDSYCGIYDIDLYDGTRYSNFSS